jgi:L-2-hydroxyglutarate oxidase
VSEVRPFDVAIIGGGIVGCAAAMALSERTRVVVLEAESTLAAHQTGNNSGVIHSGLYYKPGSLKARNCTQGREELYRFCQEQGIAVERCGKIVVATSEPELAALAELERRGQANGLEGLRLLGKEEIREREPHIVGIAGLHVPQTGIVDYRGATAAYARIVQEREGEVRTSSKVIGLSRQDGHLVLETTSGEVHARNLVNCAGLQSDRIARLCRVDPGLRIVPFRGEYYDIVPQRHELIRNLVYPVPDARFPFLGVHFTRMVKGGIEAGPNAVLALKREGYTKLAMSLRDIGSYAFYAGFWKMALKYWPMALREVWRSLSKRAFVNALRRLCPELRLEDVRRSGAGVRAQALLPNGSLCDDFRIKRTDRMIHVLNAPSPAATASIAIGKNIADMAQETFELR